MRVTGDELTDMLGMDRYLWEAVNVLAIIPARYNSTRFPGKPLALIHGKSMIERVYERVRQAGSVDSVWVATDDERIDAHVKDFGGRSVLTDSDHSSGTERCAEALERIGGLAEGVVNVQGDEPFIDPRQVDQVVAMIKGGSSISTLAFPASKSVLDDPDQVKVVMDEEGDALYFSRAPIPFLSANGDEEVPVHKHIGIYGFRSETLRELVRMERTALERTESLEQLRWLGNGVAISVGITDKEPIGIDVPADLDKFK